MPSPVGIFYCTKRFDNRLIFWTDVDQHITFNCIKVIKGSNDFINLLISLFTDCQFNINEIFQARNFAYPAQELENCRDHN
ncbi:hypothetical protein OZ13_02220 [Xanthomonas cannabis pv. cannabis]|nr:hypothetical protein OZ13_02220 [Xanthomonas cannabis pv. cannabis]